MLHAERRLQGWEDLVHNINMLFKLEGDHGIRRSHITLRDLHEPEMFIAVDRAGFIYCPEKSVFQEEFRQAIANGTLAMMTREDDSDIYPEDEIKTRQSGVSPHNPVSSVAQEIKGVPISSIQQQEKQEVRFDTMCDIVSSSSASHHSQSGIERELISDNPNNTSLFRREHGGFSGLVGPSSMMAHSTIAEQRPESTINTEPTAILSQMIDSETTSHTSGSQQRENEESIDDNILIITACNPGFVCIGEEATTEIWVTLNSSLPEKLASIGIPYNESLQLFFSFNDVIAPTRVNILQPTLLSTSVPPLPGSADQNGTVALSLCVILPRSAIIESLPTIRFLSNKVPFNYILRPLRTLAACTLMDRNSRHDRHDGDSDDNEHLGEQSRDGQYINRDHGESTQVTQTSDPQSGNRQSSEGGTQDCNDFDNAISFLSMNDQDVSLENFELNSEYSHSYLAELDRNTRQTIERLVLDELQEFIYSPHASPLHHDMCQVLTLTDPVFGWTMFHHACYLGFHRVAQMMLVLSATHPCSFHQNISQNGESRVYHPLLDIVAHTTGQSLDAPLMLCHEQAFVVALELAIQSLCEGNLPPSPFELAEQAEHLTSLFSLGVDHSITDRRDGQCLHEDYLETEEDCIASEHLSHSVCAQTPIDPAHSPRHSYFESKEAECFVASNEERDFNQPKLTDSHIAVDSSMIQPISMAAPTAMNGEHDASSFAPSFSPHQVIVERSRRGSLCDSVATFISMCSSYSSHDHPEAQVLTMRQSWIVSPNIRTRANDSFIDLVEMERQNPIEQIQGNVGRQDPLNEGFDSAVNIEASKRPYSDPKEGKPFSKNETKRENSVFSTQESNIQVLEFKPVSSMSTRSFACVIENLVKHRAVVCLFSCIMTVVLIAVDTEYGSNFSRSIAYLFFCAIVVSVLVLLFFIPLVIALPPAYWHSYKPISLACGFMVLLLSVKSLLFYKQEDIHTLLYAQETILSPPWIFFGLICVFVLVPMAFFKAVCPTFVEETQVDATNPLIQTRFHSFTLRHGKSSASVVPSDVHTRFSTQNNYKALLCLSELPSSHVGSQTDSEVRQQSSFQFLSQPPKYSFRLLVNKPIARSCWRAVLFVSALFITSSILYSNYFQDSDKELTFSYTKGEDSANAEGETEIASRAVLFTANDRKLHKTDSKPFVSSLHWAISFVAIGFIFLFVDIFYSVKRVSALLSTALRLPRYPLPSVDFHMTCLTSLISMLVMELPCFVFDVISAHTIQSQTPNQFMQNYFAIIATLSLLFLDKIMTMILLPLRTCNCLLEHIDQLFLQSFGIHFILLLSGSIAQGTWQTILVFLIQAMHSFLRYRSAPSHLIQPLIEQDFFCVFTSGLVFLILVLAHKKIQLLLLGANSSNITGITTPLHLVIMTVSIIVVKLIVLTWKKAVHTSQDGRLYGSRTVDLFSRSPTNSSYVTPLTDQKSAFHMNDTEESCAQRDSMRIRSTVFAGELTSVERSKGTIASNIQEASALHTETDAQWSSRGVTKYSKFWFWLVCCRQKLESQSTALPISSREQTVIQNANHLSSPSLCSKLLNKIKCACNGNLKIILPCDITGNSQTQWMEYMFSPIILQYMLVYLSTSFYTLWLIHTSPAILP